MLAVIMNVILPSSTEVKEVLRPLTMRQLEALAQASGVPFTTLYKIARGETAKPALDTVRRFLPFVDRVTD